MEVFHALLLQLKDVKAELNDFEQLKPSGKNHSPVSGVAARSSSACSQVTGREAPESSTALNGSNPEDVVPSGKVESVVPPLWEESRGCIPER